MGGTLPTFTENFAYVAFAVPVTTGDINGIALRGDNDYDETSYDDGIGTIMLGGVEHKWRVSFAAFVRGYVSGSMFFVRQAYP